LSDKLARATTVPAEVVPVEVALSFGHRKMPMISGIWQTETDWSWQLVGEVAVATTVEMVVKVVQTV
jgi:hypothetical protein